MEYAGPYFNAVRRRLFLHAIRYARSMRALMLILAVATVPGQTLLGQNLPGQAVPGQTVHGQTALADLLKRLGQEAEAFQRIAPNLQGRETLHQRALKPPPKFRLRAGDEAKQPSKPEWQERQVVSAYGFATLGPKHALHEIRQVISVDGRTVRNARDAQEALAKLVTASDSQQKVQSLEQLEKYGLHGAVTDFGQLILLFDPRQQERYEFTLERNRPGLDAAVIRYKQIDGPEALTVIEGRTDTTQKLSIEGEIWMQRKDGRPVRVTLKATGSDQGQTYRQDAFVDYDSSDFGTIVPLAVQHQEWQGSKVMVENQFAYDDFHLLGAAVRK
jgi:hypothetical protein